MVGLKLKRNLVISYTQTSLFPQKNERSWTVFEAVRLDAARLEITIWFSSLSLT